ncbi:MAG TPA: ATP-binding protein [Gemmatimonadaceae bacterium]|nr:ATP-binding protein [Gemmatimonadaceae bacterium]
MTEGASVILSAPTRRPRFAAPFHTSGTLVPPGSNEIPSDSISTATGTPGEDTRGTLLSALAQIAASLATGDDPTEVLGGVLSGISSAVGAPGVSLWLAEPTGMRCHARVGAAPPSPLDVRARLTRSGRGDDDMLLVRLHAAHDPLGALVLAPPPHLSPEQHAFLSTVADILAPVLRQAAHAQRLESEVMERTRQIDRERRITERIIDSLPVGLYVIDREYRISVWNRKRETGMQGVSREDALGRTIFEILHRQPVDLLRREFDEVFATGRLQIFQMESRASGETRTYRISKIPMRLDDGPVTHVITVGEDVTEWREAHDRFSQAEKLAAIGTLAAGVMHEINNPLATISACAESLELSMTEPPAPLREGLRLIQSEVGRCKGIIDSLLDFSRPKSADKSLVDVNTAIERTLFILKHHTRFKKLTVRLDLDRSLGPVVRANEEQLVQVIMSLLLNAMDAMHEQGTVELRTRWGEDAHSVLAEVVDHGEGIRRADLPKIFEPFFTTKAPGRGTGLGLSICYAIVAEHGGRIEVDSTPGEGSVFRIVLPRSDERGEGT